MSRSDSALPDSAPSASDLPPAAELLDRGCGFLFKLGDEDLAYFIEAAFRGHEGDGWMIAIKQADFETLLRAQRGPHSPARVVETRDGEREVTRAYETGYLDAMDDALESDTKRERDGIVPVWATRYDTRRALAEDKAIEYAKARSAVQQEGATDAEADAHHLAELALPEWLRREVEGFLDWRHKSAGCVSPSKETSNG